MRFVSVAVGTISESISFQSRIYVEYDLPQYPILF